jgi:hypothetical protein
MSRKNILVLGIVAGVAIVSLAALLLRAAGIIPAGPTPTPAPAPVPSGYPTIAIPYAIGLAVDDVGWRVWTPENSRDPTLADYQTIANVGRRAGTRVMTAWIMRDLDRGKILANPQYNRPIASSDMTAAGTRWNNQWAVSEDDFAVMDMVRDQAAYFEFGMHGVSHQHLVGRREYLAELANIEESAPGTATSWGWTEMDIKARAFSELLRQYYDAETSSFPKSMVPPAHAYYYGDDGLGSIESTGALLHGYGVKYANGDTGVSTQLGQGGIDHGVLFMDRAYGCNYNWEGCTAGVGDWNSFDVPAYPTAEYGWVEAHFPNLWGAEEDWVTYLTGLNDDPERMLGRNTAQVASQWLYRRYATVSGGDGTYILNNTGMPADAYTYDLLGNLTLKMPLEGKHVLWATVDHDAQVVGYYEDGYGYGYLVIGRGANPMGRLSPEVYTLSSALGETTMPAYVDLAGATFNVYSFECGARSATVTVEMYGTQDVRIRLPFTPTRVRSDNRDLKVNDWSYQAPFLTINVQGKDIQGEVGTVMVSGR